MRHNSFINFALSTAMCLSVLRKGSLTSRLTSEEMYTGTVLSQSKLLSVENHDNAILRLTERISRVTQFCSQ